MNDEQYTEERRRLRKIGIASAVCLVLAAISFTISILLGGKP